MNALYALNSLYLASARLAVWIPVLCVMSVNTVHKAIYYALCAVLIVLPLLAFASLVVYVAQLPMYLEWQVALTLPPMVLVVWYYSWISQK